MYVYEKPSNVRAASDPLKKFTHSCAAVTRSETLGQGWLPAFLGLECQSSKCEMAVERHPPRHNRHSHWYLEHAFSPDRVGIDAQWIILPRNCHLLFRFSEECFTDCVAYTQYEQKQDTDGATTDLSQSSSIFSDHD